MEWLLFWERESKRQIECLLSFLFSSWLLVVLQPCVGRRMWQEPLGWEMTVKSGPTFRACTEESLNNHMHSNTTHTHTHSAEYMHMHTSHTTPNIMSFLTSPAFSLCWCSFEATFATSIPSVFSLEQLREKFDLYMSRLLSAVPVWSKESRVVQTKGEKHLGITTTADFSLHSCSTVVMNYFQAMVIHHKADNESTLTALFQSVYCKPLYWRLELIMEIESIIANQCSNCKWLWKESFGICDSG